MIYGSANLEADVCAWVIQNPITGSEYLKKIPANCFTEPTYRRYWQTLQTLEEPTLNMLMSRENMGGYPPNDNFCYLAEEGDVKLPKGWVAEMQAKGLRESLRETLEHDNDELLLRIRDDIERHSQIRESEPPPQLSKTVSMLLRGELQQSVFPTGFSDLDQIIGGWARGRVALVGARPGVGKSALLLNSALSIADSGEKVGLISLEMPMREIAERAISILCDIEMKRPSELHLLPEDTKRFIQNEASTFDFIRVADQTGSSLAYVEGQIRQLAKEGCGIVMVDYLQLIRNTDAGNRNLEVGGVSRMFKELAMELDIAIVSAAQLNRFKEDKPAVENLRDSGELEQNADVVILMNNPEGEDDEDDASMWKECIVGKQRNGPLGECYLHWTADRVRLEDKGPRLVAL